MKLKYYITVVLILGTVRCSFAQWSNIWTNSGIYASCFAVDSNTCFAGGANGKIYRTVNGGASWDSVQTVFLNSWFNDIYFPSPNTGYACGGTAFGNYPCMIAKTTDGGLTWDSLLSNGGNYDFRNLFFVSDSVGYISGDYFVKTTDGGQSFTTISIPRSVGAMHFFNDSTGLILTREYISATKVIYRIESTADGGLSWTTRYNDSITNAGTIYNSKNINDIYFPGETVGYAVGDNGVYLHSANGGLNWTPIQLVADSVQLKDISMSKTSGVGYIAGWKYTTAGGYSSKIYKTIDYGFSWQLNFKDSVDGFYDISMATDNTVYAAASGSIFKTTSGGAAFIPGISNQNSAIVLSPNPAVNQLRIQSPVIEMADIEIFSSRGGRMYARHLLSPFEILVDVSKWMPGIYLVRINNKKQSIAAKFIVE
jgi:photosystem II stability/assembly factor-like uncharacterized protein